MQQIWQSVFLAFCSASVAAAVVGIVSQKYVSSVQEQIRSHFAEMTTLSSSRRAWKEQSISQLLGPINMQIERTGYAFSRLKAKSLYLEAKILGEGNQCIRDLLLSKGHLIPPELLNDAGALVQHYDRWLEEFNRIRVNTDPAIQEDFVFVGVGPNAIPFPKDSADRFQDHFRALWLELYSVSQ